MDAQTQTATFPVAMKRFFFREGQDTIKSFMDEMRQLTKEDKDEFKVMLLGQGYQIRDAKAA